MIEKLVQLQDAIPVSWRIPSQREIEIGLDFYASEQAHWDEAIVKVDVEDSIPTDYDYKKIDYGRFKNVMVGVFNSAKYDARKKELISNASESVI